MFLSIPGTLLFSVIGLIAYVVSFFVSATRFKEDAAFHRMIYVVCFLVVLVIVLLTFLNAY